jgi:hypothetical protein
MLVMFCTLSMVRLLLQDPYETGCTSEACPIQDERALETAAGWWYLERMLRRTSLRGNLWIGRPSFGAGGVGFRLGTRGVTRDIRSEGPGRVSESSSGHPRKEDVGRAGDTGVSGSERARRLKPGLDPSGKRLVCAS